MAESLRRSRSVRLLVVAWIGWCCVSVAFVSNVIPNLVGLFVSAIIWLMLGVITLVVRTRAPILTAIVATAVAGLATISDLDLTLRIAISASSLEGVAKEKMNDAEADVPGRIGLFRVKYVDRFQDATLFATQSLFLEDYGIAFIPQRRVPTDSSGMYRFWHIYGSWFGYEWDG